MNINKNAQVFIYICYISSMPQNTCCMKICRNLGTFHKKKNLLILESQTQH